MSRRGWLPLLASVAVHLLVVLVWRHQPPGNGTLPLQIARVALAPVSPAELRELSLLPAPPPRPRPAPNTRLMASPPGRRSPVESAPVEPAAEAMDSSAVAPAISATPIRRSLGGGRLWVRPLGPEQLALIHRVQRTTAELADSVVTALVQAYLDSLALVAASEPGPPSWTGTIAGGKFGLDARFVYLAGFRIPTVLLSLLPIPATGNQSRSFDRSGGMFEDLKRSAIRAATLDDFKAAVRELRAQSELEHRLREAQRSLPAPEEGPTLGSLP